jgi:hypothetical protein
MVTANSICKTKMNSFNRLKAKDFFDPENLFLSNKNKKNSPGIKRI